MQNLLVLGLKNDLFSIKIFMLKVHKYFRTSKTMYNPVKHRY